MQSPTSSRPPSPEETLTTHTKGIVRVPFKIAQLPTNLPAIPGLSVAIENLTPYRLESILSACRLYDSLGRGYLSQPSVLKCIGEVSPSAHAADSPWRVFLEEIAPHGEFIDYNQLINLLIGFIGKETRKFSIDPIPSIPEVLETKEAKSLIEELPSRPTTSQASRERGRLEIILEIETILLKNSSLDVEQLKLVSHQKVMEQSEFLTLLELYGLLEHFRPFLNRLLDCFLTVDNKFHYSAFVGCLQTIPPSLEQPIDLNKTYRFALPPLGKTKIPRNGSVKNT